MPSCVGVGISRCAITPTSALPRSVATCILWSSGNRSITRSTDWIASEVCSVDSTRWPLIAAATAVLTVSVSRISPITITLGASRSALRSASAKLTASELSSRWVMMLRWSSWMYSIGSSSVMICLLRLALI